MDGGRWALPVKALAATRSAAIDGDFAQLGTGQLCKCVANPERGQKRQVARANAGATNLAPREGLLFNQRYRPSRRGKQNCSRAAGRPRTDNDGVVTRSSRLRPPHRCKRVRKEPRVRFARCAIRHRRASTPKAPGR